LHWYKSGDKSQIVDLLQRGESLAREESYLLAKIISGDWKRPKKFGDGGATAVFFAHARAAYYRTAVDEAQARLNATKKRGQRRDIYREAIEEVAKNCRPYPGQAGHSVSTIEKLLRPKAPYKKTSPDAFTAFNEDAQRILAKMKK